MANFVDDLSALPDTKTDAHALIGPLSQHLIAADVNAMIQAEYDLRGAIIAGKYHGLVDNPSGAKSASGHIRLRQSGRALQVSVNAGEYRSVGGQCFYPEDYGAKGDGTTNDNAAFALLGTAFKAHGGVVILDPPVAYKIHNWDLTEFGKDYDKYGTVRGLGRYSGAILHPEDGTGNIIECVGAVNLSFENLHIQCSGSGTTETAIFFARTVGGNSNNNSVSNCMIAGGATKAQIASIASELLHVRDCIFEQYGYFGYGAAYVGGRNSIGLSSQFANLQSSQSDLDVHYTRCTFSNTMEGSSCLFLSELTNVSITECAFYSNTGNGEPVLAGHILIQAPAEKLISNPIVITGNIFEGRGPCVRVKNVTEDLITVGNLVMEHNNSTNHDYDFLLADANTLLANPQIRNNMGVASVHIDRSEGGTISHYSSGGNAEQPSLAVTNWGRDTHFVAASGHFSIGANHGHTLELVGYSDENDDDKLIVYGGASSSQYHKKLQFIGATNPPLSGQLHDGLFIAFDGTSEFGDPVGYRTAANYLAYRSGGQWVGLTPSLGGSDTWDPADTVNGGTDTKVINVAGAVVGDPCANPGFTTALPAGAELKTEVTSTGVTTTTLYNHTGGNLNLASGTLTVLVFKT